VDRRGGSEKGKHTKSIPIEKAWTTFLVAYGQNGEGSPPSARLSDAFARPGWEGHQQCEVAARIKVVNEPYMGMWESTKYPSLRMDGLSRWFQFEMGPRSVITRPSGGQKLSGPGFYEISGLAWSGGGAIRKVEVSTDSGNTWKEAEIQGPVNPKAHTRFGFAWNWNGEETVLQSRCTDERGETQPTPVELAKFWRVEPEFFERRERSPATSMPFSPGRSIVMGVQNALVL